MKTEVLTKPTCHAIEVTQPKRLLAPRFVLTDDYSSTNLADSSRKLELVAAQSERSRNIDLLQQGSCIRSSANSIYRSRGPRSDTHRGHLSERGVDGHNAEECGDEPIDDGGRPSICKSRSDQAVDGTSGAMPAQQGTQTYAVANSHEHRLVTAKPRMFQKPQFLYCLARNRSMAIHNKDDAATPRLDSPGEDLSCPWTPARPGPLSWGCPWTLFQLRHAGRTPFSDR